jgi:tetratricopeptide (TPR) repeat protein
MVGAPIVATIWIAVCYPLRLRAARPLIAGLAATWVMLGILLLIGDRSESIGIGLGGWSWWSYLRTQAEVIVHYVELAFIPSPLVFMYAWPPAVSWWQVAPEFTLVTAGVVATVVGVSRKHPASLAGVLFYAVLAPSSSVLPIVTEVAAEHRMYLPLASIIALVVLGAFRLGQAIHSRLGRSTTLTRSLDVWRAGFVAVAVVVVVFGSMTRARNLVYVSEASLARETARNRPQNAWARLAWGLELVRARRFAEAEVELRAALALSFPPGTGLEPRAQVHLGLGSALCAQRKCGEGMAHLERALALDPSLTDVHGLLGEAYLSAGRVREGMRSLERAIESRPNLPALHSRFAWVLATSRDDEIRDGARAIRHAQRALQLAGQHDVIVWDTLAAAFAEDGRYDDAIAAIDAAIATATANGLRGLLPDLQRHAQSFREHRPWRE